MSFVWVSGDWESFEENLNSRIEHKHVLTDEMKDRRLYRFDWDEDEDELIRAIVNSDCVVLDAKGTHEGWNFKLRFDERGDISRFHAYCNEKDVPIEVKRIYSPIEASGPSQKGLTTTQARTLIDASEEGYFEIPRRTSLSELGEKYGISDQAVSERLRRATAQLVRASLVAEDEPMAVSRQDG